MIEIPLLDGRGQVRAVALIDEIDAAQAEFRWALTSARRNYVTRMEGSTRRGPTYGRRLYLHREIMGVRDRGDGFVDHVNHDTLDNRRANLRVVTPGQNSQHRNPRLDSRGSSRHRGVTWHKGSRRWQAQAQLHGRYIYLGQFVSEEEAGRVARRWREEHMSHM